MAILKIRTDDDPMLRRTSRPVTQVDERIKELIEDMYETMYAADGVGLAAVQVGKLKRLLVIDDREGHKFHLINPELIASEGDELGVEGCLSVPRRQGQVHRFQKVKVKFMNDTMENDVLEAEDFVARIIQHEMDHLDGILYTDKAQDVVYIDDSGQDQ
ncbi:peptide deformylase [Peptoniphilus equinus]|uniref:Peptide deformylase n=1 Tax=Peptoniphilus equinus TaxID=3016343 RepID=A0ABY7QS11_9FIRM|nr:peptide deformylase [Peptoniphilus equinus]WBW49256.1 peptide deformylase [Peptoniphilus equinus]